MNLLLKSARIIDPSSPHHKKVKDILIQRGEIRSIAERITAPRGTKVLSSKALHISPGWLDMTVNFCDPGLEHKEDMESGISAASAGGFTAVGQIPNTKPVLDNKSLVKYIKERALNSAVDVLPLGALTKECKGSEPTEIYDMWEAGAVAFSDGTHTDLSVGVIKRSLQYVRPINALVIVQPDEPSLTENAYINEGPVSVLMGMKGNPVLAESIAVKKGIDLLAYTDSKLHFSSISSSDSIRQIKSAKRRHKELSCSVTPYHLLLSEEDMLEFDTDLKVSPPLRGIKDRKALEAALLDGTIDCITSNHLPEDEDQKKVEFPYAADGMIGTQTVFPLLNTYFGRGLKIERMIELLSTNPRRLYNRSLEPIKTGTMANVTIFDTKEEWTFTEENNKSKSSNSPFFGKKLKGRVLGIVNKGICHLN